MVARFVGRAALFLLVAVGLARGSEPPLPTTTGEHVCTMSHGGRERTFVLHLPPAIGSGRTLPLVLGFHGGGGSGAQFARSSGLPALADRAGFIAVFPNETSRLFSDKLLTWNAGHGCGYARQEKVDDVGFVRALVGRLQAGLPVDPSRIFATGHSNGAFLSYRLGSELSDLLAAIAPVAGTIGGSAPDGSRSVAPAPARSVSVVAFHGLLDEHVRYAGGLAESAFGIERGRVDLPVKASIGLFVRADGCARTPRVETLSGGKVLRETWSGGREGTEVVLYTLREGGHGWPGTTLPGPGAGAQTPYLSATGALWRFFERHPKVPGGAVQAP